MTTKMARPPWDTYWLRMAHLVASRGTCDRKRVGAVLVVENRVVATGYNGAPAGMPHCADVVPPHRLAVVNGRESCTNVLHAESNALDYAGRAARGGTLYVTVTPCFDCAKRLVNAGIARVAWHEGYDSRGTAGAAVELLGAAGVVADRLDGDFAPAFGAQGDAVRRVRAASEKLFEAFRWERTGRFPSTFADDQIEALNALVHAARELSDLDCSVES